MVKLLLFTKKKKVKRNVKIVSMSLEPQRQIMLLLISPLLMVYKKPSLENRNAPEKRYSKMQGNYVLDKHDHPMWHNNLISTLVLDHCPAAAMVQTLLT